MIDYDYEVLDCLEGRCLGDIDRECLPEDGQVQEGDFVICPHGPLGSQTRVVVSGEGYRSSRVFSGNSQDKDALAYINSRMKEENFYPDVWMESDHGNLSIINPMEVLGI